MHVEKAGVEMELKISNQYLEEVEGYSELSTTEMLGMERKHSDRHLEKARFEMGLYISNQEVEAHVMIYEPFDGHSKSSELRRISYWS